MVHAGGKLVEQLESMYIAHIFHLSSFKGLISKDKDLAHGMASQFNIKSTQDVKHAITEGEHIPCMLASRVLSNCLAW